MEVRPAGPMPFTSIIGNERSDKAFLELLKKETSGSTRKAAPEQAAKAALTEGQLRKLKLKESDVAKVTREGISHLQFHPTSSDLVIATGDKQGHIALWDVDKKTSHEVSSGRGSCTSAPFLDQCQFVGGWYLLPSLRRVRSNDNLNDYMYSTRDRSKPEQGDLQKDMGAGCSRG